MPFTQAPIRSIQHVSVDLQCEEAFSYRISIKYNFCNLTLQISPALDAWGSRPFATALPGPLCIFVRQRMHYSFDLHKRFEAPVLALPPGD